MFRVSWPCAAVFTVMFVLQCCYRFTSSRHACKAGSIFVVLAGQTPATALHLHYTKGYLRLGRGQKGVRILCTGMEIKERE